MRTSHLLSVMEEAGLSPEQMAGRLGISGMTLRRWRERPSTKMLPRRYETALREAIPRLVAENRLRLDCPAVKTLIAEGASLPFAPTGNSLGITQTMLAGAPRNPKILMESLSLLGAQEAKQSEVDRHKRKILSFKKMGLEWSARITSLMSVLQSEELHSFDKLVAYGALFYLIFPFDLIPDYIPVFGYMDDFIVLGFAAAYYVKRFPFLFPKRQP